MQTAPFAPASTFTEPKPVSLGDISTGQAFVMRNDLLTVYALMSRDGVDVSDATRRWCVVVAAKDPSARHIGEIVPHPASSGVFRVTLRHPALYSVA